MNRAARSQFLSHAAYEAALFAIRVVTAAVPPQGSAGVFRLAGLLQLASAAGRHREAARL